LDVIGVVAVALGLLVAFVVWSQSQGRDDPAPSIATSRVCPSCGHPVRDHGRRSASVGHDQVAATCRVEGCACAASFTRAWFTGRF
jgi:hypothetical protein